MLHFDFVPNAAQPTFQPPSHKVSWPEIQALAVSDKILLTGHARDIIQPKSKRDEEKAKAVFLNDLLDALWIRDLSIYVTFVAFLRKPEGPAAEAISRQSKWIQAIAAEKFDLIILGL